MTQIVSLADYGGTVQQLQGQFIATKFAAVRLNAASGTTPQSLLAVPATKYAFVSGIQITIDATCTIAAAGMIEALVSDSVAGDIARLRIYVPSVAAAPNIPTVIRQTSAPGAFWAGTSKGSLITAALDTALTAGSIRISFHYGLTDKLIGNN